ncbi:hypothetical protein GGI12_002895 [Dipsacomyces acuminosporus]|nr:hypothetical protein GGI12_002895 [Dipsacomyces acuminosporus]
MSTQSLLRGRCSSELRPGTTGRYGAATANADATDTHGGFGTEATVHSKGSATETFFHIVCIMAGTGILQLPYALKEGGWIGLFYIMLAGVIAAYSGNMLIKCLYYKQGTRLRSYTDIAEAAFGLYGRRAFRVIKDLNLLGIVGIFIVLAGTNINALLEEPGSGSLGIRFWISISAVLVWAVIVLAKEIHDIYIFSIFGTLTAVVTVVIIIWVGASDVSSYKDRPLTKLLDVGMLPLSLASICFSFGGSPNWPDIEASMESPEKWGKALSSAVAFIVFIYLCVAAIGYGVYGDNVRSPILLSLPAGIPVVVANVMITAHVLLVCPIILTAVLVEAEYDLKISSEHCSPVRETVYRVVFRTCLIAVVAAAAVSVKDFAKFVPILGAVSGSLIVFVIPIVCYIRLYSRQQAIPTWEYIWCAFIASVGLMCLVVGSSEAIAKL